MAMISDLFIQNTSGIPYLARCYGGNYCKIDVEHTLITGFFAALNSFKSELNQKALKIIAFDQITLILVQKDEFLVILGTDEFDKHTDVRVLAKQIMEEFSNRFEEELTRSQFVRPLDYTEFEEWLTEKIGTAMGDIAPLLEKRKKSFLSRLFNR